MRGILAFTPQGMAWGQKVAQFWREQGQECCCVTSSTEGETWGFSTFPQGMSSWLQERFDKLEAILFVGALGIAVRAVGPLLKDKKNDPAILCMDTGGQFVIPVAGGHLGGANQLALELSQAFGMVSVLTTATDVHHCFAVDLFAKKNGLAIHDMNLAKEVSARLLRGETVGVESQFPLSQTLPHGLEQIETKLGIYIGTQQKQPFPKTLWLSPKWLTLGVGCRKGASQETLERVIGGALERHGLSWQMVGKVATIDIKKEEPGLVALCKSHGLPLVCYSKDQLQGLEGNFTSSDFVKKTVGVDNVCERSAMMEGGMLQIKKECQDGVTIAASWQERSLDFGD